MRYWLVMPAAGAGRRFGGDAPKQYADLRGVPVIERSLRPFTTDPRCAGIVLVLAPDDARGAELGARQPRTRIAPGGAERCHSVLAGLEALRGVADDADWVLVHDAARPCLEPRDLERLLAEAGAHEVGGLLAVRVADTLKREAAGGASRETVDRSGLWRAQTPQMFRAGELRGALAAAIADGRVPTDEAQAMEWSGRQPLLVAGSPENVKITSAEDLRLAECYLAGRERSPRMRVGSGFDVHAFGPGDAVVLGGVRIPHDRGVVAHSDGDVVLHALCDALLGAAGLGDIGMHFPDTEARWRRADSGQFVREVLRLVRERGWQVVNADVTVLAQAPRLAPHRDAIRARIAALLELDEQAVNLKATTTERLGFLGRSEGLAAQATVLLGPA